VPKPRGNPELGGKSCQKKEQRSRSRGVRAKGSKETEREQTTKRKKYSTRLRTTEYLSLNSQRDNQGENLVKKGSRSSRGKGVWGGGWGWGEGGGTTTVRGGLEQWILQRLVSTIRRVVY